MSALRAAGGQLVGMFVTDWRQTVVIVLILAGSWALVAATHSPLAGAAMLVLLGAQLVYFTMAEARRRSRG
ncbi:MAG: hypothetical protein ABI838_00415 [Chloroflexota bacterium]